MSGTEIAHGAPLRPGVRGCSANGYPISLSYLSTLSPYSISLPYLSLAFIARLSPYQTAYAMCCTDRAYHATRLPTPCVVLTE
eukprot:3628143-Rhodomonas_salina.1